MLITPRPRLWAFALFYAAMLVLAIYALGMLWQPFADAVLQVFQPSPQSIYYGTPPPAPPSLSIVPVVGEMIQAIVVLIGIAGLYFVPTAVAVGRHKRNRGAIAVVNVLLGWTFLGWVIALVWALMHEDPRP